MTIRFDDALEVAATIVATHQGELQAAGRIVLLRDLLGRIRAIVETRVDALPAVDERIREETGRFYGGPALVASEMLAPDAVFASPDLRRVHGVEVLERALMGAEWTRPPLENADPRPARATLFGMKGGVGRSTALVAWARHLASNGERVLVVDLDLESPGVSTSLLDAPSDYGIVDWLVEDALDGADDELVRLMVAPSRLAEGTRGQILVAPCGATSDARYLAKLSRAYLDVPTAAGPRSFPTRLASMIDRLESIHQPTVVLLDSRAGLHDLAAIATTRLDAMTFLFAVGTRQTWSAYQTLLRGWASQPAIASDVRERLKVVAAQVPETEREGYLDRLTVAAYDAFEPLYDRPTEDDVGGGAESFNFDVRAVDAPHYPVPIYWSREFQAWDPLASEVTDAQVTAAFGEFLTVATDLLGVGRNG